MLCTGESATLRTENGQDPVAVLVTGASSHPQVGWLPGRTGMGTLLSAVITQIALDIAHHCQPADAARVSAVLLGLLSGLRRHEPDADLGLPPQANRTVLFQQTQAFIHQHLGDPDLSPETIATAHHISIRTLHRLFGAHNLTVAAWIRARRLDRCRHDLTDPLRRGQPIHAIARRWGFTNASHFTRAFRATYGITPTDYQQQHNR